MLKYFNGILLVLFIFFPIFSYSEEIVKYPNTESDSMFYADPGKLNKIYIRTFVVNSKSIRNANSGNIVNELFSITPPGAPSVSNPFNGKSAVPAYPNHGDTLNLLANEIDDLIYSDLFEYIINIPSKDSDPIITSNKLTGEFSKKISGPSSDDKEDGGAFTTDTQNKFDIPNNAYPGQGGIVGNGTTCFSKDECIGFGGIEDKMITIVKGDKESFYQSLTSSDNYFYFNSGSLINGLQFCNVLRRCTQNCETKCKSKKLIGKSKLTQLSSGPHCDTYRAGCIGEEDALDNEGNPVLSETGAPIKTPKQCKGSYFDKYYANLISEYNSPSPRHYTRFEKIESEIYMIGGWKFAGDPSSKKGPYENNNGDFRGVSGNGMGREYINEVWKLDPNAGLQCPEFLSNKDSIIGASLQGNRWTNVTDEFKGVGDIVDFFKLGTEKIIIYQNEDGFYANNYKLEGIEPGTSKRYFFATSHYCNEKKCFFSISGGSKSKNFEDPRLINNNMDAEGSDFYSDFYIWGISIKGGSLLIEKINGIPGKLPSNNKEIQNQGRLLHQVKLGLGSNSGLAIAVYGGKIIKKDDYKGQAQEADRCNLSGDPNKKNDNIEYATCVWNKIPFKKCGEGSKIENTAFDPSLFIENDTNSLYSWNYGDKDWNRIDVSYGYIDKGIAAEKAVENSSIKKNAIKETDKKIGGILDKYSLTTSNRYEWSWERHPYRCGRKKCYEWKWVVLTGKSRIPLVLKYAENNDNMKINILPIQTFTQNNELVFSGNFDFSSPIGGIDEINQKNKKYIGGIMKIDGESDYGLNLALINKIFSIKPDNRHFEFVQCIPGGDGQVAAKTVSVALDCNKYGTTSIGENSGLSDLYKEVTVPGFYSNAGCSPQIGPSKRGFHRPSVIVDKNFEITVKEGDTEGAKGTNGYYKLKGMFDGKTTEKGTFSIKKSFSPGKYRIHIGIFAIENAMKINNRLTVNQGAGYMGTPTKWIWTGRAKRSGAPKISRPENIGPIPIFYKSFVYEFVVPQITNLGPETIKNISSNNVTFEGGEVPIGSQLFFYGSSDGKNIFRLNDILQNIPELAEFRYNVSSLNIKSPVIEKTAQIAQASTIVISNSPTNHNIFPNRKTKDNEYGDFSFTSFFPFEKNKVQNLYYMYIDSLGNVIGGPKLSYKVGLEDGNTNIIIYHSLIDGLYVTDSKKPIIKGSYIKDEDIDVLISGQGIYDNIIIHTDKEGLFSFRPGKKLEIGTYKISFSTVKRRKQAGELELKIIENSEKPEIISISNNDSIYYSKPIFFGNSSENKLINIEIFTQKKVSPDANTQCFQRSRTSNGAIYSCNDLGSEGTYENIIFASTGITSDEYGNFSWQINKDLVENVESKNTYFIKVNYDGNEAYDLKSFTFVNNKTSDPKNDNNIKIISKGSSGDKINITLKEKKSADYHKVLILDEGETSISGGSNIGIKIPPLGILTTKEHTIISFLSKGSKIIYPNNSEQTYLMNNINQYHVLQNGTMVIGSINGSELKLSTNKDITIINTPKTEFYSFKGNSAITFDKKINYFYQNSNNKSQVNCDGVFGYLKKDDKVSQQNISDCTQNTASLFNDSQEPKIITPINGGSYSAGSGKYLFSGNAWPNTKIRFRYNFKVLGSTTTDNSGSFIFRLPIEYTNLDLNTQNNRIVIDSPENESLSQELIIKTKKYNMNEESDNLINKIYPRNSNDRNKERKFIEYKNSKLIYNRSFQNDKIPQGWSTE